MRYLPILLFMFIASSIAGESSTMCTIPSNLVMPDGAVIPGLFQRMTAKDGKLTAAGIASPGSVDAVIVGKGQTFLVWAEQSILFKEAFPSFQDKVKAYVAYSIDGRLQKQYPDSKGTKLIIYIVVFCKQPDGRIENIRSLAPQLKQSGIDLVIRENYK